MNCAPHAATQTGIRPDLAARNAHAVRAAFELCERIGSPLNEFLASIERANLAEHEGDTRECERLLRKALEGFRSIHANPRRGGDRAASRVLTGKRASIQLRRADATEGIYDGSIPSRRAISSQAAELATVAAETRRLRRGLTKRLVSSLVESPAGIITRFILTRNRGDRRRSTRSRLRHPSIDFLHDLRQLAPQ